MQASHPQAEVEQLEEFKLDIHIARDNINSKIFGIATPLIICNLLAYVYQLCSQNAQQIHIGTLSVTSNIAFLPIIQIMSEKLPTALAYSMSFDLISNRLQQNVEKCQYILIWYFYMAIFLSVVLAIIFGAVSSIISTQVHLTKSYQLSLTIYLIVGMIMNSLNSALLYRYLSEQRIFLILVRAAIQYMGQLAFEQFLYTISGAVQGNLMTTLSFIVINTLMIVWQFFIASGRTAYGFKLRNIATVNFAQMVKFSKEGLAYQGRMLVNGFLKFIAEMTTPFCVLLSYTFIEAMFTDTMQSYYAQNDLYIYSYVFSVVKIVPDASICVFALIGAVCTQQSDYALRQRALFSIIMYSLIFSAALAVIVFLAKEFLVDIFYDFGSKDIKSYFAESQNYGFVVTASLILYCVDIFQQVGTMCAIQNKSILELLILPVLKFAVSITSILTIRSQIGDRANYMYSIIFSEGCGDIIGIVYLLTNFIHYQLVTKKLYTKNLADKDKKSKQK